MKIADTLIAILVAIVFLTIVAVIFGQRAGTVSVLNDFSAFYKNAIKVFVSPIKE